MKTLILSTLLLFASQSYAGIIHFKAECNLGLYFVKKAKLTGEFSLDEESRALKGNFKVSVKNKADWSWLKFDEIFLRGVLNTDNNRISFHFINMESESDLYFLALTQKNEELYSGVNVKGQGFFPTECEINQL